MAANHTDHNGAQNQVDSSDASQSLHSLLNLIAATLLADTRMCSSERRKFLRQSGVLKLLKQLGFETSEARLLYWFELNKDSVLENLKSANFGNWYRSLLQQLADIPNKPAILKVMRNVSAKDSESNENGMALIALTERYWKSW